MADGKSTVQKTIDVLSYLAKYPRGSNLSTIAAKLEYPKTTVYDILKTLMDNDYVQYINPDKKIYGIGSQIYTIGITYLESSDLFIKAKPYLILLADKYAKTTFLAKRHYDRITCVYKYVSPHADTPTGNIGDRKRLHSTAIGKCYLAFDREIAPLIETIELPAITPYTITDREKLKEQIELFRAQGYALEEQESWETIACLAAPVFSHGAMVGTISMTGWYRSDDDSPAQGNEIAHLAKLISSQLDQG